MMNFNTSVCRNEMFRQVVSSIGQSGQQGKNALSVINQFMSGEIPNAMLFKIAYQQAIVEDAKKN